MTATCTVCELHAESTFKIEGMDCREEVALLERRFKNLAGLEDFSADLMGQRLHVKYDAAKLTASAIAGAVADTGMRAWLEHEQPITTSESAQRIRQALVWTSGASLALGLALQASGFGLRDSGFEIALFALSLAAGVAVPVWVRFEVPDQGAKIELRYSKISVNPELSASLFGFEAPPNTKIVDLDSLSAG